MSLDRFGNLEILLHPTSKTWSVIGSSSNSLIWLLLHSNLVILDGKGGNVLMFYHYYI